ncbi:MAG: PilZ domain-containing protein [Candidatus Sulfotelmatobacter sp.]
MLYPIERRYRRFDLQLPVRLSFPVGGALRKLETISKNVSVGGMLLKASDSIPVHAHVKLTMDVRAFGARRSVRLTSEGEVIRVEPEGTSGGFTVAIECKRPIKEIERRFSAAS